jgi:hypothetical protein
MTRPIPLRGLQWAYKAREDIIHGKPHPKQKFNRGDIVFVDNSKAKEVKLGVTRSHFQNGIAVVEYSYHERYGAGNYRDYGLRFRTGTSAWYPEETMSLIEDFS